MTTRPTDPRSTVDFVMDFQKIRAVFRHGEIDKGFECRAVVRCHDSSRGIVQCHHRAKKRIDPNGGTVNQEAIALTRFEEEIIDIALAVCATANHLIDLHTLRLLRFAVRFLFDNFLERPYDKSTRRGNTISPYDACFISARRNLLPDRYDEVIGHDLFAGRPSSARSLTAYRLGHNLRMREAKFGDLIEILAADHDFQFLAALTSGGKHRIETRSRELPHGALESHKSRKGDASEHHRRYQSPHRSHQHRQ